MSIWNRWVKRYLKRVLKREFVSTEEFDALITQQMIERFGDILYPNIKSLDENLEMLLTTDRSLVRFGDGEIQLLKGNSIPFQKASVRLSEKYKEILRSRDPRIAVGFLAYLFRPSIGLSPITAAFGKSFGNVFRTALMPYYSKDVVYYASEVTLAAEVYPETDRDRYFTRLRQLWDDKDIAIVCGERVFDNVTHNIFDNARSFEYVYGATVGAFDSYDDLLTRCLAVEKSRMVLILLGPTATVLAYDLAKRGYRAIDIGHVVKAYDWYRSGKAVTDMASAVDFFNPD